MDKCPRCKLPQKGIYKCQYCGYNLTKYNKKSTPIIRKRLKNIFSGFNQGQTASSNTKSKVGSMNILGNAFNKKNNSNRRSGPDRRKLRFTNNIPERRSGLDRRK